MSKIKVISNPYGKKISYQKYDPDNDQWKTIDYSENSNSKLLSTEMTQGFFPFSADKIVNEIIREYRDENGHVDIVFEGTDDEFKEMESVCTDETHKDHVTLSQSGTYLENARDILPDVLEVFKQLNPLIVESVKDRSKIERELDKFSDATNDVITICVLGNYSSGKSSFINALIGCEILPSGDEPVTARIFKISKSAQPDRAHVCFSSGDDHIRIRFDDSAWKVIEGDPASTLLQEIAEELQALDDSASMTERVRSVLSVINASDASEDAISDLIEVEVPFNGTIWDRTQSKFVIFDTPGSNTVSNDKHIQVLKKAMEDMSNGLPVFLTEYSTLDSTDNASLYTQIKEMKELDSRFTMIVVNKADSANLPSRGFTPLQVSKLLEEAVPRNLYSEGIFFVSSIVGLGTKTDGNIIDDHTAEIFEDQKNKFYDSESRFYKRLYRYDIMPGKLKDHLVEQAETSSNVILANSGLYSVEQEIQTFAIKYSSYNKCQQAALFLGKVIDITSEQIAEAKQSREDSKKARGEALERDKKELIAHLENRKEEQLAENLNDYPDYMQRYVDDAHQEYYQDSLEDEQEELYAQQREQEGIESHQQQFKEKRNAVGRNLVESVREKSSIKQIAQRFTSDVSAAFEQYSSLSNANKEVDQAVGDGLIQELNDDYIRYSAENQDKLDDASRQYWTAKAIDLKNTLREIVTGTQSLSEEQRNELSDIIISYQNIDFTKIGIEQFDKKDFEYGIRLGRFVIGNTNRINLEKLRGSYNSAMETSVSAIRISVQNSHEESIRLWIENLMGLIIDNIVSYNPSLRNQQNLINEETEKIMELESRLKKVRQYQSRIREMMSWKNV